MLTLTEILEKARARAGVRCSTRTFWKYHKLGLLPKGKKVAGRGNVLYFPDDTPQRLVFVHRLNKGLGLRLPVIRQQFRSKLQGDEFDPASLLLSARPSPLEFLAWCAAALTRWEKRSLSLKDLSAIGARLDAMLAKLGARW